MAASLGASCLRETIGCPTEPLAANVTDADGPPTTGVATPPD
jgi:hypothetical protein